MYRLVASAVNHPDQQNQLWGLFNNRSLDALVQYGVDVNTAVPRPHAPPVGPYSSYRDLPEQDTSFTYPVFHPRFFYFIPKSLLYHRTGDSLASTLDSWYDDHTFSGDVFHGCHLYPDGYGLSALSKKHDVPLTAYAHGTIINSYSEYNTPTQRRIDETLERAARVFCSGKDIQEKIRTIDPDAKTEVVPIGATPSNFPTERRELLRKELKIPDDATVVLFCGHLTEDKGVQDLLDVLPEIESENLFFVFIGHGGGLRDEIRTVLGRDGTPPGKLLWKLHPIAVRRYFSVADLLVLPSYSEGRPTVIYEAMASQTPVLGTDVGGIPEQVDDGKTGWVIDAGDTEALRSKLHELSPTELRRMGTAAEQRLVEKGWTWESHAEKISTAHMNELDER